MSCRPALCLSDLLVLESVDSLFLSAFVCFFKKRVTSSAAVLRIYLSRIVHNNQKCPLHTLSKEKANRTHKLSWSSLQIIPRPPYFIFSNRYCPPWVSLSFSHFNLLFHARIGDIFAFCKTNTHKMTKKFYGIQTQRDHCEWAELSFSWSCPLRTCANDPAGSLATNEMKLK